MLTPERDHGPRPASAEPSTDSTDTTSFANDVAAEYEKIEMGYLAGLYRFFGRALTSYRKYRKDPEAYEELLELDYIAKLREKPDVMETSRLVLYKLTSARSGATRNAAGRYARVVDYLFQQQIKSGEAAKYVEDAGGQHAILKRARADAGFKVDDSDEAVQDDLEESEDESQDEETDLNGITEGDSPSAFNPATDIPIKLPDGAYAKILSDDFPLKKPFLLECRKVSIDKQGQVRVVGRLYKPRSK